jgi:cytidylate kinase
MDIPISHGSYAWQGAAVSGRTVPPALHGIPRWCFAAEKEARMPIITISRGSFSGGQTLAERVAQRLGARCLSREVLVEVAATYGVPEPKLMQFLDTKPGMWERLTQSRRLYLIFLQATMCEQARQGNLVYHGQAGHLLLPGIGHVLKVRLIAPLAHRVQAIMERQGLGREAALQHIQRVDEERLQRMRYLFQVDWRDPTLYDVVLNLEHMSLETAADVVLYMAQHPEYQPTPASLKAFQDLTLSCRVQAAVAAHPTTRGIEVEVRADDGVVWVSGVVDEGELQEEILQVARTVPGVKEVISELDFRPIFLHPGV